MLSHAELQGLDMDHSPVMRSRISALIGFAPLQEQAKVNAAVEIARAQEARLLEERKAAGAALLKEVMAGNAAMIEQKKAVKAREVAEDGRILAYIKEQDAKAQVDRLHQI